jgi:hypothetical protein
VSKNPVKFALQNTCFYWDLRIEFKVSENIIDTLAEFKNFFETENKLLNFL